MILGDLEKAQRLADERRDLAAFFDKLTRFRLTKVAVEWPGGMERGLQESMRDTVRAALKNWIEVRIAQIDEELSDMGVSTPAFPGGDNG